MKTNGSLTQAESGTEDSPFDLFWKVTGEIMVNLSQPMSFPAAALAALDAVENRSSSTPSGQAASSSKDGSVSGLNTAQQKEKNGLPNDSAKQPGGSGLDEEFLSDDDGTLLQGTEWGRSLTILIDYDSLEDFCLVPSSGDGPAATALLKKENAALKSKLEAMEKQMASVRRQITLRNEQDQHLRDNIALARKEVSLIIPSLEELPLKLRSRRNVQWHRQLLSHHLPNP